MTSPVWHPFTQHALTPDIPRVDRGEGAWLQTDKGRLLDAISSWWVITHGHRHPRIVAAIKAQADQLDQVIFAGFTHRPAEDLAQGLLEIAPPGLSHVFYSDSGSTSVEVALKMALGFWRNQNSARSHIIALEHAYHGDTVGTMSAGARGVFNAPYEPLLFDVARLPFPASHAALTALDDLAKDAAALIVEPLILGSGGMHIYDAAILRQMKAICERHGTLFIADEVMTGFGRTGTLFAHQQAGIRPDFICLSKGLTGGTLPLAAVLTTDAVYETFYDDDAARDFLHSHSYTGNPLACRAALATLDIFERENVLAVNLERANMVDGFLAPLHAHPRVRHARRLGMIWAWDIADAPANFARRYARHALAHGLLLRPIGATLYAMPPYVLEEDTARHLADGALAALEATLAEDQPSLFGDERALP